MKVFGVILAALLLAPSTGSADGPVETVEFVDLERYEGRWFEIARLPNRFQKDCAGATAEYSLRADGAVGVVNTCYREDGSTRSIEGKAEPEDASNAKLQVRFNGFWFKLFSWLIKADYWVVDLADDYSYAVVGTPNRDYLWILSRERTMDASTLERLTARIASQGFDVDRLMHTAMPEAL